MRRIPDEHLARLKREVSLMDLCRDYGIELNPQGDQMIGACPFHEDPERSFAITPSTNLWSCRGACNRSGDILELVTKKEGVSLRHAVEILERRLGIAPVASVFRTHLGTQKSILVEPEENLTDAALLSHVIEFYHQTFLNDPRAMEYLQKRGCYAQEAVKIFKLGYANRTLGYRVPKGTAAGKRLHARLQKVGIYRDSGHEHLSGCVVFPVLDGHGKVQEVYGRRLFVQSNLQTRAPKHLYLPGPHGGVWNAPGLRGQSQWLLCQSFLDALSLWCNGFHNTTAGYGVNGFTADHWALFKALKPQQIVICFRNDDDGHSAANQLAQQLVPCGVSVWRLELPANSDVNDLVRASREPRAELGSLLAASRRMFPDGVQAPATLTGAPTQPAPCGGSSLINVPVPILVSGSEPEPADPVAEEQAAATRSTGQDQESASAFKVLHEGQQAELSAADRQWRVRGLENNSSFDQLKVNLRVEHHGRFHFDTFDLYSARARTAFIAAAEQITGVNKSTLEADLCALVNHLEQHQEQQIFAKLKVEEVTPALSPEEEAEALTILKSPKLLEVVLEDLHRCGLVGEETNLAVAWLVSLSRKLDKPLGVCVMSRSAAGKSSLLEAVAQFVPEEDCHQYTALTPQALFHMPENELAHKALFVAEDVGAEGAVYSLKTIQSDGQLVIACTMKDETTGQMQTRTKTVYGPVAVFLTSTSRSIDDELLNRLLVLTVDESEEQTRRIHEAQRHAQTLQGILERRAKPRLIRLHRNLQRLIRPLTVRNPLTEQLRFQHGRLRSRRDHQKYLDLINVMALAHQYQRDIKTAHDLDGQPFQYIEVTSEDVARSDLLMAEVLPRTTDELWPASRRMLAQLEAMTRERPKEKWTRRQIRERTGWSDTQVRMVLGQLVDLEFVWQFGGGQGRRVFYQLAELPPRNFAATSQCANCEVGSDASPSATTTNAANAATSPTSSGRQT